MTNIKKLYNTVKYNNKNVTPENMRDMANDLVPLSTKLYDHIEKLEAKLSKDDPDYFNKAVTLLDFDVNMNTKYQCGFFIHGRIFNSKKKLTVRRFRKLMRRDMKHYKLLMKEHPKLTRQGMPATKKHKSVHPTVHYQQISLL